jgi:general secretion pathway protein D
VLDNQQATISVGKDVPRVTNTTINAQGNPTNSVTYESLGIKLDVTPHINFDGLVTMEVAPEISDIAPQSQAVQITDGVTSPTFFVNTASTVVAARSMQTVAIGGLIRESEEESIQKIPLLGDIPIIGLAFSNTVKKKQQKELMIFLTPYVAYNSAQLQEITELEKSKLRILQRADIDSEGDKWLQRMKLDRK